MNIRAFGLELEHALPTSGSMFQTTAFARADIIDVDESSSGGGSDSARNTALELPRFGRWLGAVPAVD